MKRRNIYLEPWYLYILLCGNGNLYTGITKDVKRRLKQHIDGKGARYTKGHGAAKVLYSEDFKNHHDAAVREFEIKKLSHSEKKKLIQK